MGDFLKISQAANYLGCTTRTLKALDRLGKLKPIRTSRNLHRLYTPDMLDAVKSTIADTQLSLQFKKQQKRNKCTSSRCKTKVFDIVQQQAERIHELQVRIDKAIQVYRENKATIDSQRKEIQRLNDYIRRRGSEQLDFGEDDDFSV